MRQKNHRYQHVLLIVLLALAAPGAGYAHSGATGIVKERMELMKAIAKASKGIGAMLKRQTAYSQADLAAYAATIYRHSQKLLDVFPDHSLQPPSEALPAVWQNWDEFSELSRRFEAASAALAEVAQTNDQQAFRAQFARVGKSCKSCHRDFRKKKQQH